MSKRFDYFVIFAEMRTGSNFLEANINEIDGLTCYGEAFNPYFIGYPKRNDLVGITQSARDSDPMRLVQAMVEKTEGLPGFRYFNNHDPRILEEIVQNERCAKIILTRSVLESYVSWKIAVATDQWKLTNLKFRRSAKITFDAKEYEEYIAPQTAFRSDLQTALQISGQTAFHIAFEDIPNVNVINGIAKFLEVDGRKEQTSQALKRQNPAPLKDKVKNYDEMVASLGGGDQFETAQTSRFEPARGAVVPSYIAAADAPLIYLPVACASDNRIATWLAEFDGGLIDGFTQKTLRQWKRKHMGHRSFSVVSHPIARAHRAFCRYIVATGPNSYVEIRDVLRKKHKLPIPGGAVNENNYDKRAHRAAFIQFLEFVQQNLNGQTNIRVDPTWASQEKVLQGIAQFALPDMILRAETLETGLAQLAEQVGMECPMISDVEKDAPYDLSDFYDSDVEAAGRQAYQRDYMMFGYKAWDKPAA